MSRKCAICSKMTVMGNTIARRGKAKRLGGVGVKITATTRREFKPNLQRRKVLVNGVIKYINVCVKCIKAGKIVAAAAK